MMDSKTNKDKLTSETNLNENKEQYEDNKIDKYQEVKERSDFHEGDSDSEHPVKEGDDNIYHEKKGSDAREAGIVKGPKEDYLGKGREDVDRDINNQVDDQ